MSSNGTNPAAAAAPLRHGFSLIGKALAVALAMFALVCLAGWLDGHDDLLPDALFAGASAPWTNALPAVLLLLASLALTRRLLFSTWLALVAQALVYGVNTVKYANLASVLSPEDFRLIGQVGGDSSLFLRYLPWDGALPFTLLVAVLVGGLLATWEPPLLPPRRWPRMLGFALTAGLFASLLAGLSPWRTAFPADSYDYKPWHAARTTIRKAGLVGSLLLENLYAPSDTAALDDPAPARALLAAQAGAMQQWMALPPSATPPDIVVIQSESFFDPARLRGIAAHDSIPNFRRLQQQGLSGNLVVPTYGGGTIRTEFEVLTGLALAYFPQLQYPYVGLRVPTVPGMVSALKRGGYTCTAVHPNDGGFWNRRNVFRRMGFDRFIARQDPPFAHARRRGYYLSDADFTDVVLSALDDRGPPQFVFGISMENHGPYDHVPMDDARSRLRDAIAVPDELDPRGRRGLRTYLLHQRDADDQLGRLAAALAQRKRPTLLVFYGDHLPGLRDGYAHGFRDGLAPSEQPVPYLLIEPGAAQTPQRRNLPAWMLGAEILDHAGVRDDTWFALLHTLQPVLANEHGQPDDTLARQLASANALRLHGQLPAH